MYRGVGQAEGCLGQAWMQVAMACDFPDKTPKELLPSESMCAPYKNPKTRSDWDATPLCDDLKPTPKEICQDKEWAREAAEDLADCLEDPFGSARCAVALHPGTIADMNNACPGIYTAAAQIVRQRRNMRAALVVGGVALAGGLVVYLMKKP